MRWLWAGLAAGLAACDCSGSLAGARFACATDVDCPPGQACAAGLCGQPDAGAAADSGPPDAGRADAGRADAGGGDAGPDAGADAGTDAGAPASDAGCNSATCPNGCCYPNGAGTCLLWAQQNPSVCGTGGRWCITCDDADPCTADSCTGGACYHSPSPDGSRCGVDGGSDACCQGACTDLSTNRLNCGGCGLACATGFACGPQGGVPGEPLTGACYCSVDPDCPAGTGPQACTGGFCTCSAATACAAGETCGTYGASGYCHY